MSLTSLIRKPEIREKMNEFFPRPKINLQGNIKASPLSKSYSLIGTAADYLIRFNIKYLFPKTKEREWVAEAVNRNEDFSRYIDKAKNNYCKFLLDGKLTRNLVRSSIDLAKIDIVYRCGYYGNDIGEYSKDDVSDLRRIIKNIDFGKFKPRRRCILNPEFGTASKLVRGADADLIIDNILIDIKTSKHLRIDRTMLNQLIGYLLGLIGGVKGINNWLSIKKIGFFFSRHDLLYVIPVKELIEENKMFKFQKWFVKKINTL